ncbi:MAG: imidazolonepropionase [bacterium]
MRKLLKYPAQIVTVNTNGENVKRGKLLNDIDVITDHSILLEDDKIIDFIANTNIKRRKYDEIIDCTDKVILPGLVECHTHTAFAGSRADEFRMKLKGSSYEEIAQSGGGIITTVKAVRKSSFDELLKIILPRVNYFISQGVTTLEIKSGYGLSFYDEVKLLQVINHLKKVTKINIVPTFLGAHTFPPEFKNDKDKYVDLINNEMLPYIASNKLAVFCDGFCEATTFSAEQIDRIFSKANSLGIRLKLHTDQFNSIGGLEIALRHNAVSVDHLEVIQEEDIPQIASSDTVAVLLPGVSFFLNYGYAPARNLIDQNAIVALSTDYNPGSSHIANLNFVMSLAALKMEMTIEETISAVTINAAKALLMNESVGSIEPGKIADFAVFDCESYPEIIYNVGKNLNCMTIKSGEIIFSVSNN